jgi:hypothetical protein
MSSPQATPNVAEGERLFGYFPMATHLVIEAPVNAACVTRRQPPGRGAQPELPGARAKWFFAPDQIRKRAKEWGSGGIDQRLGAAWATFAPKLGRWLTVIHSRGPAAVEQVYRDTLVGRIPPEQGHMLSLR